MRTLGALNKPKFKKVSMKTLNIVFKDPEFLIPVEINFANSIIGNNLNTQEDNLEIPAQVIKEIKPNVKVVNLEENL
jgi:hypothetical protein